MMPEPTGELSKTWALPLTVLYLMLLGFATACLVIGHIVLLRICVAKDGAGDCVSYAYVDSGRVIASAGLLVVLFGLGFALFCVTVRNAQRIRLEAVEQLEAIRYQLQQADAALLENSGAEVVSLKSIAEISDGSVEPPKVRSVSFEGYGFPPKSLPQSMADCDAVNNSGEHNWTTAKSIATQIRDPEYNLKAFYADCKVCDAPHVSTLLLRLRATPSLYCVCWQSCFPELVAYMGSVSHDVASAFERRHSEHQVTSGISAKDEYNRTIGALFAVYWLMRIGVDGERGFSYGVDDKTWEVKKEGDKMSQPDKRKAFLEKN
eukprot:1828637-Prymnesium_polylepis.1